MALITGKDMTLTGFTGYYCVRFEILVDAPQLDGTRELDTFFRPTLGDQRARGRARFAMTDGNPGRQIIAQGSSVSATYTTTSGQSYTDTLIITSASYNPNLRAGQNQQQECEIEFAIAAVGGIIPVWSYT